MSAQDTRQEILLEAIHERSQLSLALQGVSVRLNIRNRGIHAWLSIAMRSVTHSTAILWCATRTGILWCATRTAIL